MLLYGIPFCSLQLNGAYVQQHSEDAYLFENVPSGCSSCHRCSASEPGFVM